MSKLNILCTLTVALTVVAMTSGDSFAQDAPLPPIVQSNGFGYPAANGCNNCSEAGCGYGNHRYHPRVEAMKSKYQEWSAPYHKIYRRNDAWPMPWNCADRQLYFQIWEPMIDQGFEEQCVLNAAHFDAETNELNRYGQHTVAGIMQNMPSSRKHVFINRESDDRLNLARMDAVRETINTFYGQQLAGPARVSFSTRMPNGISGSQAEGINRLWFEQMPSPVIPISSGQDINSSVGSN